MSKRVNKNTNEVVDRRNSQILDIIAIVLSSIAIFVSVSFGLSQSRSNDDNKKLYERELSLLQTQLDSANKDAIESGKAMKETLGLLRRQVEDANINAANQDRSTKAQIDLNRTELKIANQNLTAYENELSRQKSMYEVERKMLKADRFEQIANGFMMGQESSGISMINEINEAFEIGISDNEFIAVGSLIEMAIIVGTQDYSLGNLLLDKASDEILKSPDQTRAYQQLVLQISRTTLSALLYGSDPSVKKEQIQKQLAETKIVLDSCQDSLMKLGIEFDVELLRLGCSYLLKETEESQGLFDVLVKKVQSQLGAAMPLIDYTGLFISSIPIPSSVYEVWIANCNVSEEVKDKLRQGLHNAMLEIGSSRPQNQGVQPRGVVPETQSTFGVPIRNAQ